MYGDIYLVEDKMVIVYYDFADENKSSVTKVITDVGGRQLTYEEAVILALTSDNTFLEGECRGDKKFFYDTKEVIELYEVDEKTGDIIK